MAASQRCEACAARRPHLNTRPDPCPDCRKASLVTARAARWERARPTPPGPPPGVVAAPDLGPVDPWPTRCPSCDGSLYLDRDAPPSLACRVCGRTAAWLPSEDLHAGEHAATTSTARKYQRRT